MFGAIDLHQLLLVEQMPNRGRFAAQADEHVAADVRMPRHAAQHAVENLVILAAVLNSAAAAVREGHHAVDIGKFSQRRRIEPPGNIFADRRRAIHGGNDGHVIPRADSAIGAAITLKRYPGERLRIRRHCGGLGIIARKRPGIDIVRVDPLPGAIC